MSRGTVVEILGPTLLTLSNFVTPSPLSPDSVPLPSCTPLPLFPMESVAISRLLPSPLSHHCHLPPRSLHLSPPFCISASASTSLRHRMSLHSLNLPSLRRRINSPFPPVHATASTPPPPPPDPKPQSTKEAPSGAKLVPLVVSVGIGLAVRFLLPKPVEVTQQAWQLLAIFLSTIAGLVLSPLPVGAWAFIGLTASVLTKTLSFSAAFSAFTNEVILAIPLITAAYPIL